MNETSAAPEGSPGTPPARRPHGAVPVASDQRLVAEAVSAALGALGVATWVLSWADVQGAAPPVPPGASSEAGVLLCDFDRPVRLHAARRVMLATPLRWIVLTGAPPGPIWGAMLTAGASAVLPSATSLVDLAAVVAEVESGAEVMDRRTARRVIAAWRTAMEEQQDLVGRMRSLSPREAAVLGLLYAGGQVRGIAAELGVAEATVRTQVWSILRKLEVNSQLAAVVAYGEVREGPVDPALDAVLRQAEEQVERISPKSRKDPRRGLTTVSPDRISDLNTVMEEVPR